MTGRIVTFYSYKGGTGRTMALANVAWILASQEKRVLVIDWDLEAPGLHRFYHPFLDDKELTSSMGIIDFLSRFTEEARKAKADPSSGEKWFEAFTDLSPYAVSLDWDFPGQGTVDLVPAGQQGPGYAVRVTGFDWREFYERLGGGVFLEAAKAKLRESYDWILIDSRTGLSDTSGICTVQMPDDVVVCFTLNRQSIEGASAVTESAYRQRLKPTGEPGLRVFPVPTRVELGEKERLEAARDAAHAAFDRYVARLDRKDRAAYWGQVEVPYAPYYAFEEVLAVFADRPSRTLSMLTAMESIARWVTTPDPAWPKEGQQAPVRGLRTISEPLRLETLKRFARRSAHQPVASRQTFFFCYGSENQDLAEMMIASLNRHLAGDATVVWDRTILRPGDPFEKTLLAAVEASAAMLFLATPARLQRTHRGQSDRELEHALEIGLRIVPILRSVTASEVASVNSQLSQLARFSPVSVPSGHEDSAMAELADDLRRLIAGSSGPEEIDPDDPQRGQWGGHDEANGRAIRAKVTEVSRGWFEIEMWVKSTKEAKSPLTGEVDFHLHPTLPPAKRTVKVDGGKAVLRVQAYGAFTVGAVADSGSTRLELNLATLQNAPQLFRDR